MVLNTYRILWNRTRVRTRGEKILWEGVNPASLGN